MQLGDAPQKPMRRGRGLSFRIFLSTLAMPFRNITILLGGDHRECFICPKIILTHRWSRKSLGIGGIIELERDVSGACKSGFGMGRLMSAVGSGIEFQEVVSLCKYAVFEIIFHMR